MLAREEGIRQRRKKAMLGDKRLKRKPRAVNDAHFLDIYDGLWE